MHSQAGAWEREKMINGQNMVDFVNKYLNTTENSEYFLTIMPN